ncbi:MAG: porin, partial [Rickettsiales bacterium]
MEQQESSLSILFMERADVDALVPARSSGGMASFYGDRWRMDAGVFTQSVERSSNETQLAFTGRATYAPHFEGIPHLRSHIGIGASWRRMDSVRFRARPEAQITHISTIDTG